MLTNKEQTVVGKIEPEPPKVEMEVRQPGFLGRAKWAIMRGLLSSVGKFSEGIRVGYQYGFDSGTMLDYVYINQAQGRFMIGKWIDRFYLNAIGWRGIRARKALLKNMLRTEVAQNQARGQASRILDVAAGPGRYLQEFLQEIASERFEKAGKAEVRILCRDLATAGLVQGAAMAKAAGLEAISYEQGDAFNPAPTQTALGGAPNIIIVSGLYELLLDDGLIQKSLTCLYQLLAPGGTILFTTQTRHPQLEFIANVLPNRDGLPWVMKCRSAELVESWARQAGFSDVGSQQEQVGLFAITQGQK